jgi:hypothetical protein
MFDLDSWTENASEDDVNAQPSKEYLISRLRTYADADCGETGRGLIRQDQRKGGGQFA